MARKNSYFIASLGCAKNTVDSDSMASLLERGGFEAVEKPFQAEFLIVNTCGFIQQARQESLDVLVELAKVKKKGQFLIAAGCLTERYREKIIDAVPTLDGMLSTKRWMDILDLVSELRANPVKPRYHLPEVASIGRDEKGILRASIQGSSAYLKIADGCRRPCAFCSIPLIKGSQFSRSLDVIVEEAITLQKLGVKELNLISQDTTDYGSDLGMVDGLPHLLENLLPRIPLIPWVRILYAYPGYVTDRLVEVMASSNQLLPYLDIPLQHAHPEMLKRMKRPSNVNGVRKTIEKMRKVMPGLALRTTFITGFPGETDDEFNTLLEFLQEIQFDHVGVFPYSFEIGTTAEPLGDPVPESVKQERVRQLMQFQETISLRKNQHLIGDSLDILIEGEGDGISVGRSYRDAPEIDGLVIMEGKAPVGEIIPVLITGALIHDLTGIVKK